MTKTVPLRQSKHLPGDFAMWIFILAELTVFALFFLGFAVSRRLNQAMFDAGQQTLHIETGLINTLALITSSYLVARAVRSISQNSKMDCALWIWSAILVAGIYLVSKSWEYAQLINAGYDLSTNTFYTFYFFITFFHFMHVILGIIILSAVAIKTHQGHYSEKEYSGVETGASYWHMVDLVWLILFPLIYVIH